MPAGSFLPPTIWGNHRLEWGQRTHVMGIINVTPDSFSGDGIIQDTMTTEEVVAQSVALARQFVAEGATMIDVGGESTRPRTQADLLSNRKLLAFCL